MNLDQVILVDELDQEIGVMDKIEAHRGAGKLHRAVSIFLFNAEGELLIQQRSSKKIVGAGQWANTCCGNVHPGETYLDCAIRRLCEELGIDGRGEVPLALNVVTKFQYQVKCNEEFSENEKDTVFAGRYDGAIQPNPEEVSAIKWIDLQELLNQDPLAPWVRIMGERGIISQIGGVYGT
jgi:isopentenyl-diphosphate delta-isomerase